MKRISDLLGIEKTIELAQKYKLPDDEVPAQASIKATPTVSRVDPQELENCYIFDPITFSAINKITQTIMASSRKLICDNNNILLHFTKFMDNIGKVGEDVTFDEILESTFRHQLIYGNAYLETVYNKAGDDIVDLVVLDHKRMDYAKDASGNIILNNYGKPVGYTQQLPYHIYAAGKGDPVQKEYNISLVQNQIFLKPERICNFKLYTYGDRFYGVGLIEPAYKTILRKQNIESSQTNSIDQRGASPIVDYVGDEFHEPTPQMLEDAAQKLAKFRNNRYFVFPKWHKIETIESKQSDIVQDILHYLRENQVASFGLSLAFILGSGERSNKYTIASLQRFTEFSFNDTVRRTISTLKKYVFQRICDLNNFKVIPQYIWEDVGVEEPTDKSTRIIEYVKAGILSPQEAHQFALESEDLDKQIINNTKNQPKED